MLFFDYIFYRVCKAYLKAKDSSPYFASACVISLIQLLNVLSFSFIFCLILHDKSFINKLYTLILSLILLIFNYRRYIYKENRTYKILSEKWEKETPIETNNRSVFTFLYIILSLSITIGLAIYIGSKEW